MNESPYAQAWADYRKRRKITWLVPAAVLLVSLEADKLSPQAPLVLFVSSFVLYFALNRWYEAWRCPQCGRRFVESRNAAGGAECAGCGLAKWATDHTPERAQPGATI